MRHFPEYDLYICGDAHFAYAEEVRNLIRENQLTNVFFDGCYFSKREDLVISEL